MENFETKFKKLVDIVAQLRAPNGCPWDREQTPKSAVPYLLEEAFETAEAIDSGDSKMLCEELGDLLLQVVFQTQMVADTSGDFSIGDVADGINDKLIRRHPHIFGDTKVADSKEVLSNWEKIKKLEKPERESMLDGIPKGLPSLLCALRLGQKASRIGFDWENINGALAKIGEEVEEFVAEYSQSNNKDALDHEFGDILFSLTQLARWTDIDPDGALRRANDRFTKRFKFMEEMATKQNQKLSDLNSQELDNLWIAAKKQL